MSGTLNKVISILLYILLGVSIVLTVIFFRSTGSVDTSAEFDVQLNILGPTLEYFIIWAYALFAIAAVSALLFPIVNMILNPEKAVKALIPLVLIAAVVFIAYSLSSNEIVKFHGWQNFYTEMYPNAKGLDEVKLISSNLSWKVGTGLITMYIAGLLCVGSILYAEVSSIFK